MSGPTIKNRLSLNAPALEFVPVAKDGNADVVAGMVAVDNRKKVIGCQRRLAVTAVIMSAAFRSMDVAS